ncbi:SDR family oxidoreductase [Cryobacterium sp. TMS1-20-1]|uniref:SDR family NAD(P)-dependent oxidoreductase n=1 Tax=Cryobacterium sp. TMS1-20-1 TaxID=1259223 RepID=UPI00106C1463|nr:SDR family oxidoreductase [Cryobacterium sp. TMS1-20-1]TFC70146.1 SDR family oxidoreductase [Cryobacterium sp. TMS1-20-1]
MTTERHGFVLVTGATGGIGQAVVMDLMSRGFNVIAQGRDHSLLNEMFGHEPNCHTVQHGFDSADDTPLFLASLVNRFGALRGLVHCAGFDKIAPLYLNKPSMMEALFRIHALVPMTLISSMAKRGNAAHGCSIVLISSLSAHTGARGHSAYAAAKGAIEGFLIPAASELADRGVRLNIVTPGIVKTKMSDGFISRLDEIQSKELMSSYPLGLGSAIDVAKAIGFLVGPDSKWITGQTLVLDGGHLARSV